MQPGGRTPAPGDLALVQAFANTKDLLTERDVWPNAEALRAWLLTRHLLVPNGLLSSEDFQRALAFREALRALVRANGDSAMQPEALETFNNTAKRAGLSLWFSAAAPVRLEPGAGGLDGALGRLLAVVFIAMQAGTWERLKACRNERCQWVYYDTSKNRAGSWCTMTMCGNRLKTSAYRQRRKEQRGDSDAREPSPC